MLPKEKIDVLLTETSNAVGGLGPALQRLVDSTTNVAQGFKDNLPQVNDIIANAAPILDSQVQSGDNIEAWSRNLNVIAVADGRAGRRAAQWHTGRRADARSGERGVQRCARLAAADAGQPVDRHRHAQALQQGSGADAGDPAAGCGGRPGGNVVRGPGPAAARAVDQPATAVSHRLPARLRVAFARGHEHARRCRQGTYCKIPKDYQGNVVRGARNYPCVECRASARPRRWSAAAPSRTCRWAPTRGTAIRTRSCRARRPVRGAIRASTQDAVSFRRRRSTTGSTRRPRTSCRRRVHGAGQ